MDFDGILRELTRLDYNQLQQIRAKVNFLLLEIQPIFHIENTQISSIKEYLLLGIRRYISVPPVFVLQNDALKLNTKLTQIAEQVNQLAGQLALDKHMTVRLCLLIADIASARMNHISTSQKIPKSFRLMVYCMLEIRVLLEESFPNYWTSLLFQKYVLSRPK